MGKTIECLIAEVPGGVCVYLNGYRIAGSKPWGGGRVIHRFGIDVDDVRAALPKPRKPRPKKPKVLGEAQEWRLLHEYIRRYWRLPEAQRRRECRKWGITPTPRTKK